MTAYRLNADGSFEDVIIPELPLTEAFVCPPSDYRLVFIENGILYRLTESGNNFDLPYVQVGTIVLTEKNGFLTRVNNGCTYSAWNSNVGPQEGFYNSRGGTINTLVTGKLSYFACGGKIYNAKEWLDSSDTMNVLQSDGLDDFGFDKWTRKEHEEVLANLSYWSQAYKGNDILDIGYVKNAVIEGMGFDAPDLDVIDSVIWCNNNGGTAVRGPFTVEGSVESSCIRYDVSCMGFPIYLDVKHSKLGFKSSGFQLGKALKGKYTCYNFKGNVNIDERFDEVTFKNVFIKDTKIIEGYIDETVELTYTFVNEEVAELKAEVWVFVHNTFSVAPYKVDISFINCSFIDVDADYAFATPIGPVPGETEDGALTCTFKDMVFDHSDPTQDWYWHGVWEKWVLDIPAGAADPEDLEVANPPDYYHIPLNELKDVSTPYNENGTENPLSEMIDREFEYGHLFLSASGSGGTNNKSKWLKATTETEEGSGNGCINGSLDE